MPEGICYYSGIYLAVINVVAAGLALHDKRAARSGSRRVKERTLLLISAFGGSVAMLVVMRLVRHKTKHMKFMLGIPAIIFLQAAAVLFAWWKLKGGAV